MDDDGGCKEVLRKLQSYASLKGVRVPFIINSIILCTVRKKTGLTNPYRHFSTHNCPR
jgi:hypothetical protein